MGKNKKSKLKIEDTVKNITVEIDSQEEYDWYSWLIEAYQLGIVKSYEYQPEPFKLTEKQTYIPLFSNPKQKEKHLLASHEYTCDFKFTLRREFLDVYGPCFKISVNDVDSDGDVVIHCDIKGTFNRFGGDRILPIHQKLVMEKYHIYINKLVPKDIFKTLGVPKACTFTTKTKKPRKMYYGYNLIASCFKLL